MDDLGRLDPADVVDGYDRLGLERLSDAELVTTCAAVVDRPKAAEPDSFVLHAPLELMARAGLLARIDPSARRRARLRLVWMAATYAAAGPEADEPPAHVGDDPAEAAGMLLGAVRDGDLAGADAAARWLRSHVGRLDLLATLVGPVTTSLAGAAHGGIFLHQSLSFGGAPAGFGACNFARELARNPEWHLSWFEDRSPSPSPSPSASASAPGVDGLVRALRRPPSPGPLDSNFIHPTMHLTESSGLAARVLAPTLAGVDRSDATRALLRTAAHSMLQDDSDQAPYGWSHCLTMPHGLLAAAVLHPRPEDPLAVAATYVLGFRATLGRVDVDPAWAPEPPDEAARRDALDGSPDEAAAGAWHTPIEDQPSVAALLAARAAAHPDAHLAKYTLACLQQMAADPAMAHLYLAAAAFLGAWWAQLPAGDDPLR